MSWLGKIFGEAPKASSDTVPMAILDGYPPYAPPFLGWGKDLSDAEINANFQHLISNLADRLRILTAVLAASDIDTAPLLDPGADPLPSSQAIDHWLARELPDLGIMPTDKMPNPPREMFIRSDRKGAHIVFSLITDLGLLEAEAVRVRHDDFTWALDLERGHRTRLEYRRPCLLKPKKGDWAAQVIDHELSMLERVYSKRAGIAVHPFGYQLDTLLRGGFDPAPFAR